MKRFSIGLLLLFQLSFVNAQISVPGGTVSGIWTQANSPYLVQGNLVIPDDSTLFVEPGTIILFSGHYKMEIYGKLTAPGTEDDPIIFTAIDTAGFDQNFTHTGWSGLRFYNNLSDTSKLSYCTIKYSKAYNTDVSYYDKTNRGGAVYVEGYSNIIIENCSIIKNYALYSGAALYLSGSRAIIRNNKIMYNKSMRGETVFAGPINPSILNNVIAYNTAGNGGGIGCTDSAFISGNLICNNEITDTGASGAGIVSAGSPIIVNNIIANNSETDAGGTSHGGGIAITSSSKVPRLISNNIIAYNRTDWGGAISSIHVNPIIRNTIFLGNSSYFKIIEGYARLENCIFIDPGDNSNFISTNVLQVNPGFVSPSEGPGIHFDALYADWSLTDTSYCINTGATTTNTSLFPLDILGNNRIINGVIDMGPYEFAGILKNRRPVINPIDARQLPSNSSLNVPLSYWDPDEMDNHAIVASVEDENIALEIIEDDSQVWLGIKSLYGWTGRTEVSLEIEDNSGQQNAKAVSSFILEVNDTICGSISDHATWGADTVFINCNTILEDDKVLELLPGTVVQFLGNHSIEVVGTVKAIGTAEEPIVFTSKDTLTGWAGIDFENGFYAYGHPRGAMNDNDTSIFSNCTFTRCTGEVFFIDNFSKLMIDSCSFHHNSRSVIHTYEASPLISGNLFTDNDFISRGGSPVWCERYSDPLIAGNMFRGNINAISGGIFCDYNSSPVILNNVFTGNQAYNGGAIQCSQSNPLIINNTMVGNTSQYGGALYCSYSQPLVANSILWNNISENGGDEIYNGGSYFPELANCVIQDLSDGILGLNGNTLDATIYAFDPVFVNHPDDYHLSSSSSCINTGNNEYWPEVLRSNDFYGNQRIADSIIDIGASEFQGSPDPLAPINIWLNSNRLYENEPEGTYVGSFTATDPNRNETHVYSLVEGNGGNDQDNQKFNIARDSLFSAEELDFESIKECFIYVQVQDGDGSTFNKAFIIEIRGVNEFPELLNPVPDLVTYVGDVFEYTVPENTFWKEEKDYFSYIAHLPDVDSLPGWLGFDSYRGSFSGTPAETADYLICLSVNDLKYVSEVDTFRISVLKDTVDLVYEHQSENVLVYPNPFHSGVYLSSKSEGSINYAVYDNYGRMITVDTEIKGNSTNFIDYSWLPPGIYYIRFSTKGCFDYVTLVKQ